MSKFVDVILVQDVKGLGQFGEEIKVKLGYYNYLVRQDIALIANAKNRNHFSAIKKKLQKKIEVERQDAETLKSTVEGLSIDIAMKAQENGKLYGSVNAGSIVDAVNDQHKVQLSRRQISLPGAIKQVGEYNIDIQLPHSVVAQIKLNIQALADQD